MKKILLFLTCLILTGKVCAWENTTDRFVISDLTVAPGGEEAYFTVSLEGTQLYTAFNMDIQFPEGMEINYYEGEPDVSMNLESGTIFPKSPGRNGTFYHSLDFSYGVVAPRNLRVACSSNTNDAFLATSGLLFTVYVKASPYMKPGSAKITVTGQNLTLPNATKVVPYDFDKDVNITTTSKLQVNVNAANKWGTCVLPFAASVPSGVTAYSCATTNGDNLVLTPSAELAAYTPYIIYAPMGYSATLSGEVDASQYVEVATNGLLSGAIMPQSVTEGYVLQNKGVGAMFYDIDGQTFTIPSGKCWLSSSEILSKVCYGFGEEITGITAQKTTAVNTACYNLNGQTVTELLRGGVYIINGKKIVK